MREVELRRHTANDGDALTPEGVRDAIEIGQRLRGDYFLAVSSGAQRATQTVACFLAGLGQEVPGGIVVEGKLRSAVEDQWREAYRRGGAGDLDSLQRADPQLVTEDSAELAAGLRAVFDQLPDGARALAVGHSPTNEAAVLGLTGETIPPLDKGAGVIIRERSGTYTVEPLD